MSREWSSIWTPQAMARYGNWLTSLIELDVALPHVHYGLDPKERPAILCRWTHKRRGVELWFAQVGVHTIVCVDGEARSDLELDNPRRLVNVLRVSVAWMLEREVPCPPAS